jgi:hypothetical protein
LAATPLTTPRQGQICGASFVRGMMTLHGSSVREHLDFLAADTVSKLKI